MPLPQPHYKMSANAGNEDELFNLPDFFGFPQMHPKHIELSNEKHSTLTVSENHCLLCDLYHNRDFCSSWVLINSEPMSTRTLQCQQLEDQKARERSGHSVRILRWSEWVNERISERIVGWINHNCNYVSLLLLQTSSDGVRKPTSNQVKFVICEWMNFAMVW